MQGPEMSVPNGSQSPLCAALSQAPQCNCSQLTALSVPKPASRWDMGFHLGWWSISSLSFSFPSLPPFFLLISTHARQS